MLSLLNCVSLRNFDQILSFVHLPPAILSMWNVSYERAPMSVSIHHSAVTL